MIYYLQFGRRNLKVWGSYITKFNKETDTWILNKIQPIGRVPSDWQIPSNLLPTVTNATNLQQLQQIVTEIADEHSQLTFDPIQAGDFVFWDIRMAHQNADTNDTDKIRHVIYHAFLLANEQVNGKLVKDVQYCRNNCKHLIPDFPKVYANLEATQETKNALPKLTKLGQQMYNMTPYYDPVPQFTPEEDQGVKIGMSKVTDRHIAFYKRYGYVVIENAMPKEFVQQCQVGISNFLKKRGVPLDLTKSGEQNVTLEQWEKVGQRFGGMIESFWTAEHEQVRLSPVLYGINVALGGATWAKNEGFFQSPYGKFSPYHLWLYSDRQNVRFPSSWGQVVKQNK